MVISKFQNSFSALAILRYPNSFLGTINDSGILHCNQTIKIMNYSVIKCQKNGAKMNKIVQKWQFQKIFYTTMETVLGFSKNRLAELFQNYVFSTIQYLYFDLYVAECQIQFFWPASRFGVYVIYFSEKIFLLWKYLHSICLPYVCKTFCKLCRSLHNIKIVVHLIFLFCHSR